MAITADATRLFRRVIEPDARTTSPGLARYLRTLDFPRSDDARHEELSTKARDTTLTTTAADDLDGFLHVDGPIGILGSRPSGRCDPIPEPDLTPGIGSRTSGFTSAEASAASLVTCHLVGRELPAAAALWRAVPAPHHYSTTSIFSV